MASLVQGIPQTGDPEYLRYSKPISGIEANKSGYYLGKGLGDAIEQGATDANKLVGMYAEQTAYKEGKEHQEDFEKNIVDPAYRMLVKGENPNENTQTAPMQFAANEPSVLGQNKDPPPEVTQGTKIASSLNERLKNGKITQTDYDANIDALAKDLNSRFPAWRNEIGAGLSKATGRDNANLSIAGKLRDIVNALGVINQGKNKVLSEIDSAGGKMDPSVNAKLRADFQSGKVSETEAMFQVYRAKAIDENQNRALRSFQMHEDARTLNKETSQDMATDVVKAETDNFQNNFEISNGAGSPAKMQEKLVDLMRNPNDIEASRVASDYALSIPLYEQNLRKKLQPFAKTLGQSGIEEMVQNATKPYKEFLATASDPSKVGSAVYASQLYANAVQRQAHGLISKDELGQQLIGLKAIMDLGGPRAGEIFSNFLGDSKELTQRGNELMSKFKLMAIGSNPDTSRHPPNVADAIDTAFREGGSPKEMDKYIDFLANIKDMPDQQARNMAYAYYNPKNIGLVGQWSSKTMDPRTGNTESGQINVFKRMGDASVLDRIYKLGDPKLNGYVKDFMEKTFSYTVFPTLLKDTEAMSKGAGDRLGYNDETQHFELKPGPRGMASSSFVQNTIHRLNFAIDSMKNVAKHENVKDPNGYLIGLIMAGNPQAFSRDIPGFPGEINKAIQQQALTRQMQEEAKAKAKKDLQEP